jgi:hypothetical protein
VLLVYCILINSRFIFIVSNFIAVSQLSSISPKKSQLSSSYAQWRKESTIIPSMWIHILKAPQNVGMLFD